MDNKEHYLPWVAIWGLVFGVISGIPLLNCCCFLWFPIGALLTVMNVANKAGRTVEFAEGAILGLIVGGIAGVSSGMIGGTISALSGTASLEMVRSLPNLPPDQREMMEAMYGNPATSFAMSCCMHSVIGPALGAIGGLIGSAVFKKDGSGSGGGAMPQPRAY